MTAGASSPPGKRLIAFSALTDSALPGRNEDVSFFCACSNLPPWLAKPAYTTTVTKKTTHLALRPAGTAKTFIESECCSSGLGRRRSQPHRVAHFAATVSRAAVGQ